MLVYHDVYSYGVLLLGLVAKMAVTWTGEKSTFVDDWASEKYNPGCSLVHESLVEDPGFYESDGRSITELGMSCIEFELDKRPSMINVIKSLEGLLVCGLHGNAVGMWYVKKYMLYSYSFLLRIYYFCDLELFFEILF